VAEWKRVTEDAADFAAAVRKVFDAHKHKTLATLRKDGSPRISGIEATFTGGELWLGMMPGSRKARDLQRDPRLALHSGSTDADEADPNDWPGDAKLSGRAVEITDRDEVARLMGEMGGGGDAGPGGGHVFRVDISEVVRVRVVGPPYRMAIDLWREGEGLKRFERE
jgi:hypothetical protein